MIKFTGLEKISDEYGNSIATIQDFWAWAYSDLTNNTLRGAYAEYLVGIALGAQAPTRRDWEPYDILTSDGIRIEVKTSAYLQSWKQKNLSKIIFGIPQTHKYDFKADAFDFNAELVRQADVYVFCVETCKAPDTLNERDLSQWDFYVVATELINEKLGSQKTVSLSTLIRIGARKVSFSNLRQAVVESFNKI